MISISATNPCHLYHLALALHAKNHLTQFHSGYPKWKLAPPQNFPLSTCSTRTLITYAALKYIPHTLRPKDHHFFRWQDQQFDQKVAEQLQPSQYHLALPGQALATFKAAKAAGISTILSHATGPTRRLTTILKKEYAEAGVPFLNHNPYDASHTARIEQEHELSDYHSVASKIVADGLIEEGIPPSKIIFSSYGIDQTIFHPPKTPTSLAPQKNSRRFHLLFAGQFTLRKGIRKLLQSLERCSEPHWTLSVYGHVLEDAKQLIERYRGKASLQFHGSVSQSQLAQAMRQADHLILPSLEEGFGLVVPQALACGLPCILSDQVGSKSLLINKSYGSTFSLENSHELDQILIQCSNSEVPPLSPAPQYSWDDHAEKLLQDLANL